MYFSGDAGDNTAVRSGECDKRQLHLHSRADICRGKYQHGYVGEAVFYHIHHSLRLYYLLRRRKNTCGKYPFYVRSNSS